MDTEHQDGAAVRVPPPLVYLAAVLAGVPLHAFVLPLPIEIFLPARIGLASAVALAGLWLMAGAARLFRRTGQDPKPWRDTPEIISTGVYRVTRNPMYGGMALLQAGIGVGLANGWIVALIVPVLAVIYVSAIRPEEAYLERKFGAAYVEYRSRVRRWF